MNNQALLENNLRTFLSELGEGAALNIEQLTNQKIEARLDKAAVHALAAQITESYHRWTENWLHPYCSRTELAAVLVAEMFRSKPLVQCQLPPEKMRNLHRMLTLYAFAAIMGMYVKLAASPMQLRDQFITRFITVVAQAYKKNAHTALPEIHKFIEKNFKVIPPTLHFAEEPKA
ncbi:MAG: hypothetical protein A2600_09340 [Candidatus Lambdaproteobacteria bacterium RIFOXYD1_FULL_56_27]|uniref:Uncharacterized protein n=1 Tax=Candidatus Lambdaproteobacteria bacterium RIFOXYD2_FULL_56_26 TaxID=1817773 RepID=A0A1F6GUM6_9PROT|nr:MAG: hypothetical protein A2557_04610 [Candidatus Lambdaproteobacteria bacterium RIFOXYD2_FULL_56_26]OGH02257.1 MAG: hypothetical protein A2426_03090 [Candidatus Lambdaproteobacteria bacterium RIFOXYC1_FULL_56_13]OGH10026.1 MAG: hypothetical protein A2600_09340 [Candidatus Lambdaproteobacteria bacterium RIFOXYD1_FULL_56_27]